MKQKKKESFKINTNRWIVSSILYVIVIGILLSTLFFASAIEEGLKLHPNLNQINEIALEVHFVDVGQGDAILVRFPNKETMLVDAGPRKSTNYLKTYIDNIFFKNSKRKSFDYVLLTHGDADHSGGMADILDAYEVGIFYCPSTTVSQQSSSTYKNLIEKLDAMEAAGEISVVTSTAGIIIKNESTVIAEFLSPAEEYYSNTNDYSPIIMLTFSDKKVLLTGDAGKDIEKEVMDSFAAADRVDELDVDVFKVGHHGSATSGSPSFLEAIKAEYAVISVAKQNSYNHPSDVTIANLLQAGTNQIYQTAKQGNIICYINYNEDVEFLFISNAEDYLYISWYVIVIILTTVAMIIFLWRNVDKKKVGNILKRPATKKSKNG